MSDEGRLPEDEMNLVADDEAFEQDRQPHPVQRGRPRCTDGRTRPQGRKVLGLSVPLLVAVLAVVFMACGGLGYHWYRANQEAELNAQMAMMNAARPAPSGKQGAAPMPPGQPMFSTPQAVPQAQGSAFVAPPIESAGQQPLEGQSAALPPAPGTQGQSFVTPPAGQPSPVQAAAQQPMVQTVAPRDDAKNLNDKLDRILGALEELRKSLGEEASSAKAKVDELEKALAAAQKEKAAQDDANKDLVRQLAAAKKQIAESAKRATKKEPEKSILSGWSVVGMTEGQAWLVDSGGQMKTVRVGDSVAGARVESINLGARKVVTTAGALEYRE